MYIIIIIKACLALDTLFACVKLAPKCERYEGCTSFQWTIV